MSGKSALQFDGEFSRYRKQVRSFQDGVPDLSDKLEPFGDAQLSNLSDISHAADSTPRGGSRHGSGRLDVAWPVQRRARAFPAEKLFGWPGKIPADVRPAHTAVPHFTVTPMRTSVTSRRPLASTVRAMTCTEAPDSRRREGMFHRFTKRKRRNLPGAMVAG